MKREQEVKEKYENIKWMIRRTKKKNLKKKKNKRGEDFKENYKEKREHYGM